MNQRGSSSAMLLVSWLALTGFLGFCFDMALVHVYGEQLRTALEAAATAGAMQSRYYLTIRLTRERYRSVLEEDCYPVYGPDGNPVLDGNGRQVEACDHWYEWRINSGPDEHVSDWEEKVWWSHAWAPHGQMPQQLYEAFPGQCSRQPVGLPSGSGIVKDVCKQADVVAGSCALREFPHGTAAAKAWAAYHENSARWAGAMEDLPQYPVILEEGSGFVLGIRATAQVRTRFVRMLGFETLPVEPRALDGSPFIRARPIRNTVPPTCPDPQA